MDIGMHPLEVDFVVGKKQYSICVCVCRQGYNSGERVPHVRNPLKTICQCHIQ